MVTYIKWGHISENALYCEVNSAFSVFLRNIHSDMRFLESSQKEVHYLDVNVFRQKISITVFAEAQQYHCAY